jgi:hypothetical protein
VKAVCATAGLVEAIIAPKAARTAAGAVRHRALTALARQTTGTSDCVEVLCYPYRERSTSVVIGSYLTGEHCRKIASAEAAVRMPEVPRRHACRTLAFDKPVAVTGKNERPARPMMRSLARTTASSMTE